ncbi:MAG: cytidylate kinase family protein [Nitrospirae bacterium]|nr:cytidylate kinase family protein [Nitrospirota bacterium]
MINGFIAHLITNTISHVLKVCLIADIQHRVTHYTREESILEKDATAVMQKYDNELHQLTKHLFNKKTWDPALYDILIPLDNEFDGNTDGAFECASSR